MSTQLGFLTARDSAHTTVQADPAHGIEAEWCSYLSDETGYHTIAVYGATADEAIAKAAELARIVNAAQESP